MYRLTNIRNTCGVLFCIIDKNIPTIESLTNLIGYRHFIIRVTELAINYALQEVKGYIESSLPLSSCMTLKLSISEITEVTLNYFTGFIAKRTVFNSKIINLRLNIECGSTYIEVQVLA